MDKPNWRESYMDFPSIPEEKKWNAESTTDEQVIIRKLLEEKTISEKDERKIRNCFEFYKEAIPQIQSFNLSNLNELSLKEYLEYFNYVFNFSSLVTNDLTIFNLYRIVDNEAVLQKKERIREQTFMSYPPKHVVNKIGKYNRANTPDFPVFYGTDSIDNALLELRPEAGRLVSIGQWIPKKGEQVKLNSYPIYHNPMLVNINQTARDGYFAFQEIKKKGHPLLMEFMEVYFSFISVEFAKPVKNHIEYLYSALFAQRIFLVENDPLPEYNFDCLIYPSVGNTYQVENLAIKPNIIDEKFRLFKVFEFEITKTYYEKTPPRYHPEEITVVEYQNYEVTDWVEKDGYIVW